jgi:hypothetical protein
MKIFKEEDNIFLENLVKSYTEVRNTLKLKQDEILALSKELEEGSKSLESIRDSEAAFVKSVAEREKLEESEVIKLILAELESKK